MSLSRGPSPALAIHSVLQSICGWTAPTAPQVAMLEVLAKKTKTLPAGSNLTSSGPVGRPHYLLSGWACWRFDLANGRRQIIQLVLPGERLGGVACLHGGLSALTPVNIIPVEAVEALCLQEASKREARTRSAGEAAQRALVDQIVRLGQLSAYERMAHLILELRQRLIANGPLPGHTLHFPLTQEALASALGVSLVHINRVLQRLRKERLIELGGGRLTILDLTGLERASGVEWRSENNGDASAEETGVPL